MSLPTTVLLRTQSDERLVALAQEGHERAFEAIVERYRRPLLRACRRVLPEARAEDALQHALLAAWAALERGDRVRDLRPWLFRIAHNTALNQLRINGYDHDELHDLVRGGPGPEEEAERRMVVRATLTGLAALPERQREALLQTAVQGRGQEAVARDLGLSEGAVRQLVHRARVHLRAAATAITPMPIASWLATVGPRGAAIADRVGELTAGGMAASAAKLGAIAVLAGGVAAGGPAIVHVARHDGSPGAAAAGRHDRASDRGEPVPGDDRGGRSGVLRLADDHGRRGSPGGPGGGDDGRGRGGPGDSGHGGGSGRSGSDDSSGRSGRDDSSGSSGSTGSSGSGSGSSGDDGGSSSGSGSSGDDGGSTPSGTSGSGSSGSTGSTGSTPSGSGSTTDNLVSSGGEPVSSSGPGSASSDSSGSSGSGDLMAVEGGTSSGSGSTSGGSTSSGPGGGGSGSSGGGTSGRG